MMPQLRQVQTVMNLLMTCQIIKENINKGKLRETATESGPCEHRRYEKPQAGLQHLTVCVSAVVPFRSRVLSHETKTLDEDKT